MNTFHEPGRKVPIIKNCDVLVIPLRALIAGDVDGLLMAGRCISGDFIAHASYQVTGNAVAVGQAAVAARSGRPPHELPWPEVQAVLP
jgi:hypothetical protein